MSIAIRVTEYVAAVNFLRRLGYKETTSGNQAPAVGSERLMRLQPTGKAGFPQIYLLDPDHHVNRDQRRSTVRKLSVARQLLTNRWEAVITMLHWSLVFLVIAIIAAILGFGGIAGTAVGIAKILFFVF